MIKQFSKDVHEGLSKNPRTLPSKYFYDKRGDELFVKIMQLPEYYLTRAELEIFQTRSDRIIQNLNINPKNYFELIELGAGNGFKTKELIKKLLDQGYHFDFFPIDISANALELIENSFKKELPELTVKKLHGDYFQMLDSFKETHHPKVVLFLGSSIGNMDDDQSARFLAELSDKLYQGDKLLLGVDLIKDESIVLPAYDDTQGITREFNLNLLRRINCELEANFDIEAFEYEPEYSEHDGCTRSYLKSTKCQEINISKTGGKYTLKKDERILTEISRKYNDDIIKKLIEDTAFKTTGKITDRKGYFASYIFCKQ